MSDLGNREVFSRNLRTLMQQLGKTRNQICDDLDFKYSTFNDWYNGNKYPRIDKIEMLANYFGVLKSDLIEDKGVSSNLCNNIPYLNKTAPSLSDEAVKVGAAFDKAQPGVKFSVRKLLDLEPQTVPAAARGGNLHEVEAISKDELPEKDSEIP